jgi:glycosidase
VRIIHHLEPSSKRKENDGPPRTTRRPWNETRWNELYFARTGKSTGVQYYNLDYLQDLNQENSTIDSYLKTAAEQFQNNGADAFRLDALKSVTWGWLPSTRTTRLDTASRA